MRGGYDEPDVGRWVIYRAADDVLSPAVIVRTCHRSMDWVAPPGDPALVVVSLGEYEVDLMVVPFWGHYWRTWSVPRGDGRGQWMWLDDLPYSRYGDSQSPRWQIALQATMTYVQPCADPYCDWAVVMIDGQPEHTQNGKLLGKYRSVPVPTDGGGRAWVRHRAFPASEDHTDNTDDTRTEPTGQGDR